MWIHPNLSFSTQGTTSGTLGYTWQATGLSSGNVLWQIKGIQLWKPLLLFWMNKWLSWLIPWVLWPLSLHSQSPHCRWHTATLWHQHHIVFSDNQGWRWGGQGLTLEPERAETWYRMSKIPATQEVRPEGSQVQALPGYRVHSRPAWAIGWDHVLK